MPYGPLADATGLLHAAFVLFVVAGQILILCGWARGWRWTRNPPFRYLHLAAIGFVVLEAWFGVVCPLTSLESWLRMKAGLVGHGNSFIAYWLQRLLYYQAPHWVFTTIYTVFGALVAASLLAYPPRRRGKGGSNGV